MSVISALRISFRWVRQRVKNRCLAFWEGLGKARKVILAIGVLATGVNETWSLVQKISTVVTTQKDGWLGYVKGHDERVIEKAPDLDLPRHETNGCPIAVEVDQKKISFLIGKMIEAHRTGDYSNAVAFAELADVIVKGAPRAVFIHERLAILSVQVEEAFYCGEYKKSLDLIKSMRKMPGVFVSETPSYRALRDALVTLTESENELIFFSPVELGKMRKWNKIFLEEYLSFLAAWGFLQPIILDPRTRNHHTFYYEEFFGFKKALPYRKIMCVTTTNEMGDVVCSNEASVRWAGRRKFVPVDVDACVAKAMSLSQDEQYHRGLYLEIGMSPDSTNVNSKWFVKPNYSIASNAVCQLKYKNDWTPGKRSPQTELNTVYLSMTNERHISHAYIPLRLWIIIVMLAFMAFAPPTSKDSPNRRNDAKDKA